MALRGSGCLTRFCLEDCYDRWAGQVPLERVVVLADFKSNFQV